MRLKERMGQTKIFIVTKEFKISGAWSCLSQWKETQVSLKMVSSSCMWLV